MTMDGRLIQMCIEAATESGSAVEAWRRQRRSLERMPPQLAEALLHRLLRRRLLFPSLLEVFKHCIENINLGSENFVDTEWMAYLGSFRYLRTMNLADCYKINSAALWGITGLPNLKELDLSRCSKVTDTGIRHLLSIPTLERLSISETGVTAGGICLLSSLTNLSRLDLGGLPVTDSALSYLKGLKDVEYLDLWGSKISNEVSALFEAFPKLTFLNVAWTKVTKLPNLHSLKCLNMSNCMVHTLFEGEGDKPSLEKLILSGAEFSDVSKADVSKALSDVETRCLSFLDMSNTSTSSFLFLPLMKALTYLDLSCSSIVDESVEEIAQIGANLRYLNLSKTKVTSVGVGILAGHVPKLETILLSSSFIDDNAISYIEFMPSLKDVNLSNTKVKGLRQVESSDSTVVSSFTSLQSLSYLERLELEGAPIQDVALSPLSSFCKLIYLSLGSNYLTDACLQILSSVENLVHLCIHDTVLTNSGLHFFVPPPTLKILDLKGCWLLTENDVLSFSEKHPKIRLKHELLNLMVSDDSGLIYRSPPRENSRTFQSKQQQKLSKTPLRFGNSPFSDQRLKYTREEMLALQRLSPAAAVSLSSQEDSEFVASTIKSNRKCS